MRTIREIVAEVLDWTENADIGTQARVDALASEICNALADEGYSDR